MRAFCIAVFLLAVSAAFAVREAEDAAAHNAAIARSLLGAENACGAPERGITEGDLLSVADLRIVAIVPEVGGVTSDSASPALLWSWSAKCPKSAEFPVFGGACPTGKITYHSPSEASLSNAALRYRYGGMEREIPLGDENPVAMGLDESFLSPEDYAGVHVPLQVFVSGEISVQYAYKKTHYERFCQNLPDATGCGCELKTSFGVATFSRELEDAGNFSVEAGENEIFWVNPPLQSRLSGQGTGKFLLFARRMMANLTVISRGERLGFAEPYSFSVRRGECGEEKVSAVFSPRGDIFVNASNESLLPFQLVEKNRSFRAFYAEFDWSADAGRGEMEIVQEDFFGNNVSSRRVFAVRAPEPFAEEGRGQKIRQASERESPALYPGESPAPEKAPDFSVFAALAALPFALWAAAHLAGRRN